MKAQQNENPRTCFVLMPVDPALINVWDAVIRPAIEHKNMTALRSDQMGVGGNLMASVRRQIIDAEVVIAVLTGNQANVMYELGLAHAAKKKVILLQVRGAEQPQAFPSLHVLEYDPVDFPSSRHALIRALESYKASEADDLFPELSIPNPLEMAEYAYLKQVRKKLMVHVMPENCSIFFNNQYLGPSPQAILVNPDAERPNVLSVYAVEQFEYYRVLSKQDLALGVLNIEMTPKDSEKSAEWVHTWLMLRRNDPDSPVLARAISNYFFNQGKYDLAMEEAQFCISQAPEWIGGYNTLGLCQGVKGDYDKATSHFQTVVNLAPENHLGWYNLACADCLSENNASALTQLQKIIDSPALSTSYVQTHRNNPGFLKADTTFDGLKNSKSKKDRDAFARVVKRFDQLFEVPRTSIIAQPTPIPKTDTPQLPCTLQQFKLEHFQCIQNTALDNFHGGAPWIIFTGDNGDGKTSVLQALAIGLNGQKDADVLLENNPACRIGVEIRQNGQSQIRNFSKQKGHWLLTDHKGHEVQPVCHLATYGPARLELSSESAKSVEKADNSTVYSLLYQRGNLRNIEHWLKDRALDAEKETYDAPSFARAEHVKQTLVRLMPNVTRMERIGSEFKYTEKGFDVSANQLSAGQYNILAMVGDLLIRLYEAQPEVVNPNDLQGIVLIDELDVHLHPTRQKDLPGQLSEIFPKIQFIASTHSVIPIMGAPKGSIFLRVRRDETAGTQVDQPDIEIGNLLPNAVLTSPLFNMDSILAKQNHSPSEVRTDDDFAEAQRKKQVHEALERMGKQKPILPEGFLDDES